MDFSSTYVAEPPPGQIRYPIDPPNLHMELTIVGVSTTAVALVAVTLRLFTRARVTEMGVHVNDRKLTLYSIRLIRSKALTT